MNVDSVRDERIRRSERSLRNVSYWTEVHMRADNVIWAMPRGCCKSPCSEDVTSGHARVVPGSRNAQVFKGRRPVCLPEQPGVVTEILQSERKSAAERSDAPAESCKGRRP